MVFYALIFGLFMPTRLYLPSDTIAPPNSPAYNANWEDTSIAVRTTFSTTKRDSAMTTVSFADANAANRDILYRQYHSPQLAAGQTITGEQALKIQIRASQVATTNNMFVTALINIINVTTTNKTLQGVVTGRDDVAAATSLTNRQWTKTSAAGNYTTVAGDYIVLELGMAGDPDVGSDHDTSLRLGDVAILDLLEDDLSVLDSNPWLELADTLTFVAGGFDPTTTVGSQGAARRGGIGIRQMRRRDSGLYVPAYLKMAA